MSDKQNESFEKIAEPLMKWLAENVHPHHYVIVTSNTAELLEGQQVVRNDRFLKD